MTMWEPHAQPFTPLTPAVDASHVGRSPSLINEDQVIRVQVEVAFKPGSAFLQNISPVLLDRVPSRFLVRPRRSKNRHKEALEADIPGSDKACRNSASVMSGVTSRRARIWSAWPSIL